MSSSCATDLRTEMQTDERTLLQDMTRVHASGCRMNAQPCSINAWARRVKSRRFPLNTIRRRAADASCRGAAVSRPKRAGRIRMSDCSCRICDVSARGATEACRRSVRAMLRCVPPGSLGAAPHQVCVPPRRVTIGCGCRAVDCADQALLMARHVFRRALEALRSAAYASPRAR